VSLSEIFLDFGEKKKLAGTITKNWLFNIIQNCKKGTVNNFFQ
jgi:hypothetical protein